MTDTTEDLDENGKKHIQKMVGSFLYFDRAVDLTVLSEITRQKSKPTKQTKQRVKQFLYYMVMHLEAVIQYYASTMVLSVHSDTTYFTASKARSRAGGHFFWTLDCSSVWEPNCSSRP